MQYIVTNRCHGGFGLSKEAVELYCRIRKMDVYPEQAGFPNSYIYWLVPKDKRIAQPDTKEWNKMSLKDRVAWNKSYEETVLQERNIPRDDKVLVQVVRELGEKANGQFAQLEITEIPNKIKWVIDEYDGYESVEEEHRSW